MSYAYRVIRWPYEITASNQAISVDVGGPTGSANIPIAIYLIDGLLDATDLLAAVATAVDAALAAAGSAIRLDSIAMTPDGNVLMISDSSSFDIDWSVANSLPASALGFVGPTTTITGAGTTSAFQADQQWHAGTPQDYDSDNTWRQMVLESRNLLGRPVRVELGDEDWLERRLMWTLVAAARIKDSRAQSTRYAQVAGVAVGEDNTWEELWRYLKGPSGPYSDNRVYIYVDNDPATAVREGPYEIVLTDTTPDMSGVGLGSYRQDMSAEFFDVDVAFWRSAP